MNAHPERTGLPARVGLCALLVLFGAAMTPLPPDAGSRGLPSDLTAQDTIRLPSQQRPVDQRACDQRFAGIRVEVRTPDGRPVPDARVEVRLESDRSVVRVLERALDRDGGYIVLDDATPGPVTPGIAYTVDARRGSLRATARLVVGADERGCHVRILEGPSVMVLR